MVNRKISGTQFRCMVILFLTGSNLVIGTASTVGRDAWLAQLVGMGLTVPMGFVFARLLELFPGSDLFDIAALLYGKVAGKALTLLFTLYFFHIGSVVLRTISEFIQISNMPETPQMATLTAFGLLSVWMSRSGGETVGRVAKFTLPILCFSIGLTILLSLRNMDFTNILPVMDNDFPELLDASTTAFSLPFAEIVIFMVIYPAVEDAKKPYRLFFSGLGFATFIMLCVTLRNLFVLGAPSMEMFLYPSYESVSIISVGDFFTRIEVLIGMNLVLAGLVKVCVCMTACAVGLAKLVGLDDYRPVVACSGAAMITFATIAFTSSNEMMEWLKLYKYLAFPFQVVLPLIFLATAEVVTRLRKPAPGAKT